MAKAKTTKASSATLGFEQQIWDAACELWGHIPAADYRKIFTGLIFLKYISTAFEKKYAELLAEGDGFERPRRIRSRKHLFCTATGPLVRSGKSSPHS